MIIVEEKRGPLKNQEGGASGDGPCPFKTMKNLVMAAVVILLLWYFVFGGEGMGTGADIGGGVNYSYYDF